MINAGGAGDFGHAAVKCLVYYMRRLLDELDWNANAFYTLEVRLESFLARTDLTTHGSFMASVNSRLKSPWETDCVKELGSNYAQRLVKAKYDAPLKLGPLFAATIAANRSSKAEESVSSCPMSTQDTNPPP